MSRVFVTVWFVLCAILIAYCFSTFLEGSTAAVNGVKIEPDDVLQHEQLHKLTGSLNEHRLKSEENKDALSLSLYVIGGLLGLMNTLIGFIYVQGQRTTREFVRLQVDQLKSIMEERKALSAMNAGEICKLWDCMNYVKREYLTKEDHDRICEAGNDTH